MDIYNIKEKVIGIILLSVFSVICVFAIFLICAFATNPIIYSIMACFVFGFLTAINIAIIVCLYKEIFLIIEQGQKYYNLQIDRLMKSIEELEDKGE